MSHRPLLLRNHCNQPGYSNKGLSQYLYAHELHGNPCVSIWQDVWYLLYRIKEEGKLTDQKGPNMRPLCTILTKNRSKCNQLHFDLFLVAAEPTGIDQSVAP